MLHQIHGRPDLSVRFAQPSFDKYSRAVSHDETAHAGNDLTFMPFHVDLDHVRRGEAVALDIGIQITAGKINSWLARFRDVGSGGRDPIKREPAPPGMIRQQHRMYFNIAKAV